MRKWLPVILVLVLAPFVLGHGISEADKAGIIEGGNLRYLWLGAGHMLTGYDHLLFLFGVIFYLTGIKDILKFITVFTVGHSLTLVFATFMKITANFYLVDAVIALSVCYKAFDNLDGFRKYLKFGPPHLLAMVFGFGLIHGFGLSTRLQELPLPTEGLLARILSFNLGVEVGQVAALAILVALLEGWRMTESYRKLGGIANVGLLIAGAALFLFQMNGYLRGGGSHHDESHQAGEKAHPHGKGSHTHDSEPGGLPHPHPDEPGHTHGHDAPDKRADSASTGSAPAHSHDGEGHSHDH